MKIKIPVPRMSLGIFACVVTVHLITLIWDKSQKQAEEHKAAPATAVAEVEAKTTEPEQRIVQPAPRPAISAPDPELDRMRLRAAYNLQTQRNWIAWQREQMELAEQRRQDAAWKAETDAELAKMERFYWQADAELRAIWADQRNTGWPIRGGRYCD